MPGGQRIHTLMSPQHEPVTLTAKWRDLINWGTQENTYVVQEILYSEEIPIRTHVAQACPYTEDTACSATLNGQQYASIFSNPAQLPCPNADQQAPFDLRRVLFDLFPDTATVINSGAIQEIWVWTPKYIGSSAMDEVYAVANPGDPLRYPVFAALLEDSRVNSNRKFVVHFPNERDDTITEVYHHRIESIMQFIYGPGSGQGCNAAPGSPGWRINLPSAVTPYMAAESTDPGAAWPITPPLLPEGKNALQNQGDSMLGWAHAAPYTFVEYRYDNDDTVPTNGDLLPNYPTGFPLDLTRNDRRSLVNKYVADYPPGEAVGSKNGFQAGWQWRRLPKNNGTDR